MSDIPEQTQTWTERVGKTLETAEQFTADEVKTIATDAVEEELNKLPLIHLHVAPEPASYAERVTPQKSWERLLARVTIEGIKSFLGERQER